MAEIGVTMIKSLLYSFVLFAFAQQSFAASFIVAKDISIEAKSTVTDLGQYLDSSDSTKKFSCKLSHDSEIFRRVIPTGEKLQIVSSSQKTVDPNASYEDLRKLWESNYGLPKEIPQTLPELKKAIEDQYGIKFLPYTVMVFTIQTSSGKSVNLDCSKGLRESSLLSADDIIIALSNPNSSLSIMTDTKF